MGSKKKEESKVGDVWEDEHYKYEKKEGYTLKQGKNSETFQEIRKYLEEKSKCNNKNVKQRKNSTKDKKFIKTVWLLYKLYE